MKSKKLKTVHCPVCSGEIVILPNGRMKPHSNGAERCVFSGQPAKQIDLLNEHKTIANAAAISLSRRLKEQ